VAQRRFHYDAAFEHYLRERAVPYVAVDEAKRAIAAPGPEGPRLAPPTLKSFDFVVYSARGRNLLVDVKGRKHSGRSGRGLDNWVTKADVECLAQWEKLFGQGYTAAFAFLYWCAAQPPDALFHEVFTHGERWYAVLAIGLSDYRSWMKPRSDKWGTVSLPAEAFKRLSGPMQSLL
jgi:hypothetical protein